MNEEKNVSLRFASFKTQHQVSLHLSVNPARKRIKLCCVMKTIDEQIITFFGRPVQS